MTLFGAVRFPPIRRFGARDGSVVCSAMSSFFRFFLLTLALFALMATGAGVGGWVPKIFWSSFCQAICGVEVLKPHVPSGACAAHVATGSRGTFIPSWAQAPCRHRIFPFFRGLPFLGPQSGAQCDCYLSGRPHFLLPCSGHPTTCCCDRSLSAPCFVRA